MVRQNCKFSENQMAAYCQQLQKIAIITTINSFRVSAFDPIVNQVVLTTNGTPMYNSASALNSSEYGWCQHHGAFLCGDDCHYQLCAI